jgi:hypothetical protein
MSMHTDHEGGQSIHCTVGSCKHNHQGRQLCNLNSISVCPNRNVASGQPDESKCDSYEH